MNRNSEDLYGLVSTVALIAVLLVLVLSALMADAAVVTYSLPTHPTRPNFVEGKSDKPLAEVQSKLRPDQGAFTVSGTANPDTIDWPEPPGCAQGTGQLEWARVTTPPTMAIRTDIVFFECKAVAREEDVDRVVFTKGDEERRGLAKIDERELLLAVVGRLICLASNDTAGNCATIISEVNALFPDITKAKLATMLTRIRQRRDAAEAVKGPLP